MHLIYSDTDIISTEVGHFSPEYTKDKTLSHGQIGYILTGLKSVRDAQIGDTIIAHGSADVMKHVKEYIIPGFKKVKPYVYAGMYPVDTNDYEKLKDSLEKLSLNDSAVEYSLEDSKAL